MSKHMDKQTQIYAVGAALLIGAIYLKGNRATKTARVGGVKFPEPAPAPIWSPPPSTWTPVPTPTPKPTPKPSPSPTPTKPPTVTGPRPLSVALPSTEPRADPNLAHTHPIFQDRFGKWLAAVKRAGFRVLVYECYRTPQRQRWLYAIGREIQKTKPVVTYTLDSLHRYGLAADLVPLKASGAADWSHAAYDRLYKAVPPSAYGLELLSFEKPHVQVVGGQSFAAARGIVRDWRA